MKNSNELLNSYQRRNLQTKLLTELENSLKDPNFEEFLSKLGLSKEKLCKYTSTLEESFNEYDHCKKCKCLEACQNKVTGYAYLPKKIGEQLEFYYKACKYQNKFLKEEKKYQNVYLFEVPEAIRKANMKEVYIDNKDRFEVLKWINNFLKTYEKNKKQKGLYLHGNFGCGKTYLVSAVFHELANKGVKSAIIFWPEYLNNLKSSFNEYQEFKNKMDYVKKVPLLLIDDIGAEATTSWSRDEILMPILQYRMDSSLPTFFTSNCTLKQLESHFSNSKNGTEEVKARRIIERIKQLTEEINLVSDNLRK